MAAGNHLRLHVFFQDAVGVILRLLHIGLVEGVDAQHRARDGRRELPAEELGAQVIGVCRCSSTTGWPGVSSGLTASSCSAS